MAPRAHRCQYRSAGEQASPCGSVSDELFCIGADENGLGPRLGPMVVTAVLARVKPEAAKIVARRPRGGLARRLGDSKGLVAHGNVGLAEAWARVLVERGHGRHGRVGSPDEVIDALTLDDRARLTEPCPSHVYPQCWGTDGERFGDEAEGVATRALLSRDLDRLAARGIEVVAVRSVVVCTLRLNEAVARGHSRFVVDLHAMERLVLAFRELAGVEVKAVCGKVGGFGQYGKVFGPLAGRLHMALEEGRKKSAYRFPGLGEVAFVMDGDRNNLLVGMASLVGKWLREVMMERIVRFYGTGIADLPPASGYHDPVTETFVLATDALRRRRRVPHDCFERDRLEPLPE
jgi:ribonuclease HII